MQSLLGYVQGACHRGLGGWILVGEVHKALRTPMGSMGVPEGEVSQVAYRCLSDGVCNSRIYSHLKVVSVDCCAPGFSQPLSCVVTSVFQFG